MYTKVRACLCQQCVKDLWAMLTAYQQKDEELAQGPSAFAIAVGAVGADTCPVTIRVSHNTVHMETAVIVYQPQVAF